MINKYNFNSFQPTAQPYRTMDQGTRPSAPVFATGYPGRPGCSAPVVAEVRPIISQNQTIQRYPEKPRAGPYPTRAGMQVSMQSPNTHSQAQSVQSQTLHQSHSNPSLHSPIHHSANLAQQQDQFMRQREIREQSLPSPTMRPRSSSTSSLLGNHPLDDILYLRCNVCSLTYGSPHSFRKHFAKAHGFDPRSEHVTVRSISAAKSKSDVADAKIANSSPPYRGSPRPTDARSPGASESPRQGSPQDIKEKVQGGKQRSVMQCFQCGQDFPTRDWGVFKRHVKAHEVPQLRCHPCRQSFTDERELRDHNATYHPLQNYACRTCGATFNHPTALAKHAKLTHPELPEPDVSNLQCLYCPYMFTSCQDMTAHIQEHEGLAPALSSKDFPLAQHSPQIRRASPDSTNDPEEKSESHPTAQPKQSQGIPLFNLALVKDPKPEGTEKKTIMDLVRDKVEEVSWKYLFDDSDDSKMEDESKSLAIKQEVNMEVKQEIGNKLIVMNYQEKGSVKESKIETTSAKMEVSKASVDKPSDTMTTALPKTGYPLFRLENSFLGTNAPVSGPVNGQDNKISETQSDTMCLTKPETSSKAELPLKTGSPVNPETLTPEMSPDINTDVMQVSELKNASPQVASENPPKFNAEAQNNECTKPANSFPDLSENTDRDNNTESVKPLETVLESKQTDTLVSTQSTSTLPQIPSEPTVSQNPPPGAPLSMFDDTDTDDDDDGGSKLVICDDMDTDMSTDHKDDSIHDSEGGTSLTLKRPLEENDSEVAKRMKTADISESQ